MYSNSKNIFSISQITNQVKSYLERDYCNLWIRGEVSTFKTYPSGHSYLTLKDENAEISAVIFHQYANNIVNNPKVGMEVLVMGDLSLYGPRGKFQLKIKNIYLSGDGELWAAFENLKKKLEAEGIFNIVLKKKIPRFPQKIGIITSSEGAALRDILQVINRRAPHVQCYLYPVSVQGVGSADQIAKAIEKMNHLKKVDLLIIGRGGGSIEDLWSFNEEIVVRAIFNSSIPIISAVGHETDTTLADYAADVIAPTPSAAAELATINKEEILQSLDHLQARIIQNIDFMILKYSEKISALRKRHGFYKPNLILETWQTKVLEKSNILINTMDNQLKRKNNDFKSIKDKLNLLNPKAQLNRGYALAIDANKKVLYGIDQIEIDDIFQLQLASGKLKAKVLKKRNSDG